MAVRDKSLLNGLFPSANFSVDDLEKAPKKTKAGKHRVNSFEYKMEEGSWDEFSWQDWKKYFILKAKEYGITNFISGDARKESSILKSLMQKFSASEIKDMIDFVWQCDEHKLVQHKQTMGIWILSSGYLQSITQLMLLWKENGTLKPQAERPLTESKWKRKESAPEAPVKKSRITIGGR